MPLIARLCFVQRLPATTGWSQVRRLLATGLQSVQRLVLAHWAAKLCPRVSDCRALGILGFVFQPTGGRSWIPGLWLVLRLLLAYLYVRPDPGPSGGQEKSQGSSGHRVS